MKVQILSGLADAEARDYASGKKCWRKDAEPAVDYSTSWSRQGCQLLVEKALVRFFTKAGFGLAYNTATHGPWINFSKEGNHHNGEQRSAMVSTAARMAGWLDAAADIPRLVKVLKVSTTPKGVCSPYNHFDLAKVVGVNMSPGKFLRHVMAIMDIAKTKFPARRLPIWAAVLAACNNASSQKAAVIAMAHCLIDQRSFINYTDARTILTRTFQGSTELYQRWRKLGWIPKNPELWQLDTEIMAALTTKKMALLKKVSFKYRVTALHEMVAAANIVIWCDGDAKKIDYYLTKIADVVGIHDAGINLGSLPHTPFEWRWFYRITKDGVIAKKLIQIQLVLTNFTDLVLEEHWDYNAKGSLEKALHILTNRLYPRVVNHEFAVEAAKQGVSAYAYSDIETRWCKHLNRLTHQSVPAPGGVLGIAKHNMVIKQLDKADPRDIFVGIYTGCCQHISGQGSSTAWYSHEEPNAAVWVVERFGRIIAQSFVWRGEGLSNEMLVIDNIEAMGHEKFIDEIRELYMLAIDSVLGRLGITEVYQGTSNNDVLLQRTTAPTGEYYEDYLETPNCYSDASSAWFIVVCEQIHP